MRQTIELEKPRIQEESADWEDFKAFLSLISGFKPGAQGKTKFALSSDAQRNILTHLFTCFSLSPHLSTSFSAGGSFIIQATSFRGSRCFSGMKHLGKQNVQMEKKHVTAEPGKEKPVEARAEGGGGLLACRDKAAKRASFSSSPFLENPD